MFWKCAIKFTRVITRYFYNYTTNHWLYLKPEYEKPWSFSPLQLAYDQLLFRASRFCGPTDITNKVLSEISFFRLLNYVSKKTKKTKFQNALLIVPCFNRKGIHAKFVCAFIPVWMSFINQHHLHCKLSRAWNLSCKFWDWQTDPEVLALCLWVKETFL